MISDVMIGNEEDSVKDMLYLYHQIEYVEIEDMNKWITEDWEFTISVISGKSGNCRLGFETGDTFHCQYEVPTGFCPKTMFVLFTLCEIVRCGGDYISRGSKKEYEIDFPCADGEITFHLQATHI